MKKKAREARYSLPAVGRSKAFYYSVLLHVALVLVFIVGIDWKSTPAPMPAGESKVMNAKAVDPTAVEREMQKLKTAEQSKQREAERKVAEAEQRRQQEEQKLEQLKAQKEALKQEQEAENRKLAAEKQRLEQEKDQVATEKRKQEQEAKQAEEQQQRAAAEKKKLDAEKKKVEAQRKADAAKKAEAEKKRKADEAKKAEADKQRKAEEAKKKAAAEEAKKKAAAEEQRKAAEAKALADELAAEEAELAAAAQARADQSELSRYFGAIAQQVTNNFSHPRLNDGLKCTLLVRMIPGGQVIDAKVVKSSGDPSFDRQAELAVRKASPLPVPDEPRLFEQIREINFEFDPSAL